MELAEHLTFSEQIEDRLVLAKTGLETTLDPRLRRLHEAEITRLETRRKREIMLLAKTVEASNKLARRLASYDCLRANKKAHLTALVAATRKLVILANALVARNADWQPYRP